MEKENKMAVMPMPKLVVTMSLPLMLSLLIQSLYNIVDSIFVAKLSEDALTAASLVFPMQLLMIAEYSIQYLSMWISETVALIYAVNASRKVMRKKKIPGFLSFNNNVPLN